ncbi:hypothetical protein GALMADRAFT_142293 [Galerina marginata CBS 339.88]|uniref:G-protein coupled receptors family 1 profile domain-containing protein n=1 Tax=Galerina marginata (strain CBS 339.88) TaxID=685588 RepID=A0A067SQC0_GALM3|nr:hypothetical protein GALMADRAFT_142293 [Galerina marginata CBS 339.88]
MSIPSPSRLGSSPPIVHPSAPPAYFPPSVSSDLIVASYLPVAALVVHIWDMLNNVNADYKLLTRHRLRLPSIVYCISRLSTLACLLVVTIYTSAFFGPCDPNFHLSPWLYCIAMQSTSLLFFFRVSAMYHDHKPVALFFFLTWLGILGGSLSSALIAHIQGVGPTKNCLGRARKSFVWTSFIVPLVNDTLIFIAISFRLTLIGLPENTRFKDAFRVIIFGKDLPSFSKALLRDGQAYYLTTLVLSFTVTIVFFIESIPSVYRVLLSLPNLTIVNFMACRVYRRTKSGMYRETSSLELSIPMAFHDCTRTPENSTALLSVNSG